MLRLPAAHSLALRFPSSDGYLLDSIFFRSPRAHGVLPLRLGVGLPVSPHHSGSFLWRKPVGSLKFPGNPFMLLPCSQTPVGSPRLAHLRRFDSAPAVRTTKAPTLIIISRLNHTALAPAPYASCRHRCRLRNVRFRLVASLCKVGFFSHEVPVLCFQGLFSFRLHAFPHILGLLDAT